jgi:hypothetical protein
MENPTMHPDRKPPTRSLFEPGELARDGFMGRDERPILEIVRSDAEKLARCAAAAGEVADFLQSLIDEGKRGLEGPVVHGDGVVRIHWARGMLPCPFGEPRLHPKITAVVTVPSPARTIRFSQLGVHLIREHGFFGGNASPYRLEPEEVVALMRQPFIHRQEE